MSIGLWRETEYVIQWRATNGTPVSCGISVDPDDYITSAQNSLLRFRGSKFSILKTWLYKIDREYKVFKQEGLF